MTVAAHRTPDPVALVFLTFADGCAALRAAQVEKFVDSGPSDPNRLAPPLDQTLGLVPGTRTHFLQLTDGISIEARADVRLATVGRASIVPVPVFLDAAWADLGVHHLVVHRDADRDSVAPLLEVVTTSPAPSDADATPS